MPQNFVECAREQAFLMPPDPRDWLPEGHLVWFILAPVEQMDLSAFYASYRLYGWGRAAFDPQMMVALLLYAYARGERSSRAIERKCVEDVAYRVIAAHQTPDHATIARFRARHEVPVSLVCAVAQIESSFTNVFGHDDVRNPIKSIHGQPNRVVTEGLYKTYLHHRHLGEGCQGVGPMQLTSAGLQDRADQLGGCFKPGPNIRVGVELLAGNIRRLGLHAGVKAYNGSGDQAE
jgi:transposase